MATSRHDAVAFARLLTAVLGLTLACAPPARAATLTWWATGSSGGSGGTGTWNTSDLDWTADGLTWSAWNNTTNASDIAWFGGTAGTVTLSTGITAGGLTFDTTGYTVAGSTLTLANTTGTAAVTVNSTSAATISSIIAGSNVFNKLGSGTLTLSGNNTYSGTTVIDAGSVIGGYATAYNGGNAPSFGAGNIVVNNALITGNAAFTVTGGQNTTRSITLNSGTWNINYAGGGGEYVRDLTLNAGLVTTSNGSWFRAPNGGLSITTQAASGTSTIASGFDLTLGNLSLNVADGAATIDLLLNGFISQNSGAGSGARSLTKSGAGTVALAGAASYTGTTTINAGTLQIGNAGTAGALSAAVTGSAGATLAYNRTDTYGGNVVYAIGGGINVAQIGTGTLTLAGPNTYTGTTSVSAGSLVAGGTAAFGDPAGPIVVSGGILNLGNYNLTRTGTVSFLGGTTQSGTITNNTVDYDAQAGTVSAVLAGSVGLSKTASGTVTLSGTNTFTGTTRIVAGGLSIGNASALQNSTLDLNAADAGTVSSIGQNSTLGGLTGSRNLDMLTRTLSVGNNGANTTYSGTLSNGALTKIGAGTLTLTGTNAYAGTTTISGGTLQIGGSGQLNAGSYAGSVVLSNTAALQYSSSASQTLSGVISGVGTIVKDTAASTLTLTGANTFTGGLLVNSGTVVLNSNNTTWNTTIFGGTATVNNGARLQTTGSWNSSATSVVNVNGGGVFEFTAAYTTGGINTVYWGTFALSSTNGVAANVTGVGAPRMGYNANGTISSTGSVTNTFSAALQLVNGNGYTTTFAVGSGTLAMSGLVHDLSGYAGSPVVKTGAGTLVLSASNTYSGATTVSSGTIIASTATALGTGGTVTLNDASTGSGTPGLLVDATAAGTTLSRPITIANQGTGTATLGSASTGGSNAAAFSGAVTLQRDVTLSGGTAGGRLNFTGGISGTGNVNVAGTAPVVYLTTANTYSGSTTINAGATLQLSDSTAVNASLIPDSSAVNVLGTLTLAKGGTSETISGLFGSGTVQAATNDILVVGGSNGSGTFSGVLRNGTGTLSLAKTGAGVQSLTGVNTYTGSTAISSGTLQIAGSGQLNAGSYAGSIVLSNSGALQYSSSAAQTLSSVISGTGTIVKDTAASALTLTAANTFTGGVVVNSGTLVLNAPGANWNTSIFGGTATINNGGRLQTVGGRNSSNWDVVNVNGGGVFEFASAYDSSGNNTTYWGTIALNSTSGTAATVSGIGAARMGYNANGTISSTGSVTNTFSAGLQMAYLSPYTVTFAVDSGTLAMTGLVSDMSQAGLQGTPIIKTGVGTLSLSAANTFSGGVTVNAGTVVVGNRNAFGAFNTNVTKVVVNAGGAVNFNGVTDSTYGYTISGSGPSGAGAIVNTGSNIGNGNAQMTNLRLAADAAIGGAGNFGLLASAYGTTTLDLNGKTLTKAGSNDFYLVNTTVTAGTGGAIRVSGGTFSLNTGNPGTGWPSPANLSGVAFSLDDVAGAGLALNNVGLSLGSLAGGGSTGGNVTLGSATLTTGSLNANTTYSGVIAGTGGLLKVGTGTQILAGDNTYSGATTISGGTLQIGAGGTTGSIAASSAVSGSAGTALVFVRSDAFTYSGTFSGAGNLVQLGTGTLTLSAANTYTGTTSLSAGVMSLGSANAIGTTGTISFTGGTLQATASNTTDYSGRFSTAPGQAFSIDTNGQNVSLGTALTSVGATLAKLGSGTLTLTANNTFSGNTTISGGVLRLGSGGASGSVAGAIVNNATLAVNRSDAFTLPNAVSGTGGLVQAGSGTTTLSGVNSYSGATTVSGGMLAVTQDSNLGTAPVSATPGNIVLNGGALSFATGFALSANRGIALGPAGGIGTGTLDVASGQTASYGGIIADNGGGTGGLVKTGAGILSLTGNQTYTGTTSVDAGTLQVTSGSLASAAVVVAGGATLSGAGAVNATTVGNPGILTPGVVTPGVGGVGTLTLASLMFTGSATVNMGVQSNAPSSLLQVNGAVTTAGPNTVTFAFGGNLASINSGTYTLLSYTGMQLADVSAFLVSGGTGGRQSVTLVNATQAVNLEIGNAFPIWSGTDGSGWSTTDNWVLSGGGGPTSFLANDTVVFNDSGDTGNVTLSQNVNPATTTFSGTTLAYTISSTGGFGITSGNLVKSAPAALTITTSNSFAGGTTLSAGTIRMGNDAALGTGGITVTGSAVGMTLSSDGGTARTLANALHLDGDVMLGSVTDTGALTLTGTVTFDGESRTITTASDVTLSGLVTNGGFTKAGSGVLTITGSNDYAAGTTLSAGTLRVGNNAALGAGGITLDGGVLSSDSTTARTLTSGVTFGGDVTLGDATNTGALTLGSASGINLGGAARQVTTASDVTFAGVVSNGGLTKTGAGTLTLSTANSHALGTTLSGGSIVMNNIAALGTGTVTYAGSGAIRPTVGGTIANTFVIGSGVSGTFDSSANSVTFPGTIANAGTFTLTTTATQTLSGVVSGSGAFVKAGAGTVTLAGTSTYTGDTTISAGILEIGGAGRIGGGIYSGAIANSGTLSVTTSQNQRINGVISGGGSLTKSGAGLLTLNASNSFAGGSTITGGVLAFVNGALGSGSVTISGGTLRWVSGNAQDVSSQLVLVNSTTATLDTNGNAVTFASGFGGGASAALVKSGAGTLSITGTATYTGPTTISAGAIDIAGAGLLGGGSYAGAIANAGSLSITTSAAQTLSGVISGAGALSKTGAGTLTLSGTNTFTGQLTVTQGTLSITSINNAGANGTLGNSVSAVMLGSGGTLTTLAYTGATASSTKPFTLATGGTGGFDVVGGTSLTLSGVIGGSAGLLKTGEGTLVLSGSNTYTGNTVVNSGTIIGGYGISSDAGLSPSFGTGSITVNNARITASIDRGVGGGWNTTRSLILNSGTWGIDYAGPGGEYMSGLIMNAGVVTAANGSWFRAPYGGLSITSQASSGTSVIGTRFDLTFSDLSLNVADGAAAVDLALNGTITQNSGAGSGARSVTKAGVGTVLFGAASTYTGNTTVNAGVLKVSGAGQLYSGGYNATAVVSVGSGATLELDSFDYGTVGGLGLLRAQGDARVLAGGTISVVGTTQASINDFQVANGSSGAFTMAQAGATLTLNGIAGSNISIGGPLTFGGAGNITVNEVIENNTGAGSIIKAGLGTLTFGTSMTYTGSTTINTGTFVLTGAGQLGGGNYGGAFTNNAAFVSSASANQTFSGVVSGAGSFAKSGAGTLTLSNGANTFTSGVSLTGGVLGFANGGLGSSGTITLGGGTLQWASGNTQDISSRLALVNGVAATLDTNGNDVTLASALGGSASTSLVKIGGGALALSASNSFTGGLTVSAGSLRVGNEAALGTGTVSLAGGVAMSSDGATARAITSAVAVNGDVTLGSAVNNGALTFTGPVDFGGQTRQLTTPSNVTIAAAIANAVGITKAGVGTLTLSASNTYTGPTSINAGTLALVGAGDISSGSAALVTIAAGAALDISAASGARTIGALDGGDATTQVLLGGNSLRSVMASGNVFGGVISGSGGFTKAGSETLELTNLQAFTGPASIEEGNLLLASGIGLASASKIYVASGASIESYGGALTVVNNQTLGGYGTVYGELAFASGGVLSPGGSVGTLYDSGNTTWNGGMHYLFEVNSGAGAPGGPTGWDLFSTTGDLTLVDGDVSPIVIDLTSLSGTSSGLAANFDPSFQYAWKFAVAGNPISTFNPGWFTVNTSGFQNLPGSPERFYVALGNELPSGYPTGSSNELYLVYAAVPEPSTVALAAIGLAAAGWAASRRRRRRTR